jgi:hypothetical protein
MLRAMRRTARSPRKVFGSFAVRLRRSAWLLAPLLVGACTVYGTDLLETTGGVGAAGAGGSSGTAGSEPDGGKGGTGATGGKAGDGPLGAGGADGGEPTGPDGGGTGGSSQGGTAAAGAAQGGGGSSVGGGTGGSGGSGGTGGATAGSAGTGGMTSTDLVDDFEDQDTALEPLGARNGYWYLFDDGTTGTTGPKPLAVSALVGAPAELGGYAIHITATGFTGFGTGLGADFKANKKVYDASKYTGIRFWAKVGAGKNTKHRVQITDSTTDSAGGKCNAAADAVDGEKCADHFGVNETFTTTWTQYTVRFDQMAQVGWGLAADSINTAAVYSLQIAAKPKLEVDLWVDQFEFF